MRTAVMLTPEPDVDMEEEPRRLEILFIELVQECRHNAPGARLSARLRHDIERLRPSTRRELVSGVQDGCAPLWMAAHRGATELVEYLAHVCGAPLEQPGALRGAGGEHKAPALWAAAVGGHEETVQTLISAGAEVDARSDTGSTALRSACFMSHGAVAKLLLENGADPCSSNWSGGTCLINAVQSSALTELLLTHGADPKAADVQLKTPLHYAAQEHRQDTAQLLLDHGADPTFKSRAGDDALRIAAIKGSPNVLRTISNCGKHSNHEIANAYELLGATYIQELLETRAALNCWRRSTAIRQSSYLDKTAPVCEMPEFLQSVKEWNDLDDLQEFTQDSEGLQAQAMLVALRVLGPQHNNFISRVTNRAAIFADTRQYLRALEMWTWALELRIKRDTLLYTESASCACAGTATAAAAHSAAPPTALPAAALLKLYAVIARGLPECAEYMVARPICRHQATAMDRAMRCMAHLLLLILQTDTEGQLNDALIDETSIVISKDIRSALTGDSLLHMMVSTMTTLNHDLPHLYPGGSEALSRLCRRGLCVLLSSGADVNCRNLARCTALHVAALARSAPAAQPLLDAGAHLDTPSRHADTCLLLLQRCPNPPKPLHYMTLGCLAANSLIRHRVHVGQETLPRNLHAFLELHRP